MLKYVSLAISKNCNIGCSYCIIRDMQYKAIDNSNLEQVLDWIQNNAEDKVDVYLGYKEPLVDFLIIKSAVELVKLKYKKIKLRILTNALLLNDERSKYLLENRDYITVSMSLDGKDQSNSQRIFKNGEEITSSIDFELIFNKYRGLISNISMVVSPASIRSLYDNIVWITQELGSKSFAYSIYDDGVWTKEDIAIADEELSKVYNLHNKLLGTNDEIYDGSSSRITYDIESDSFSTKKCGAGVESLMIDGAGDIYSCTAVIPEISDFIAEKLGSDTEKASWVKNHSLGNIKDNTYASLNKRLCQDEFVMCDGCVIKDTCIKCKMQNEIYKKPFAEGTCDLLMVLDKWLKKTAANTAKHQYYTELLTKLNIKCHTELIKSLSGDAISNEKILNILSSLIAVKNYSSKISKTAKYITSNSKYNHTPDVCSCKDIYGAIFDVIYDVSTNLMDIKKSMDMIGEKNGI